MALALMLDPDRYSAREGGFAGGAQWYILATHYVRRVGKLRHGRSAAGSSENEDPRRDPPSQGSSGGDLRRDLETTANDGCGHESQRVQAPHPFAIANPSSPEGDAGRSTRNFSENARKNSDFFCSLWSRTAWGTQNVEVSDSHG